MATPCIVVHGGAGAHEMILLDPAYKEAKTHGVQQAARAGWEVLQGGSMAVDAVQAALVIMEDDPYFNAGVGSNLTRTGQAQMDAVLMDGQTMAIGGVCGVSGIQNAVKVARAVRDQGDCCLLYGEAATSFAIEQGFTQLPNSHFVTPAMEKRLEKWKQTQQKSIDQSLSHDTVGAVAMDVNGNIVSGISTGGSCGMRDGRLGAGATVGAGTYADITGGGVSTTGQGDALIKTSLAAYMVDKMRQGMDAQESVDNGLQFLQSRLGADMGWGGAVGISKQGQIGTGFTTKCMPWASVSLKGTARHGIFKDEQLEFQI